MSKRRIGKYELLKIKDRKELQLLVIVLLVVNAISMIAYIQNQKTKNITPYSISQIEFESKINAVIRNAKANIEEYNSLGVASNNYRYKYQNKVIEKYSSLLNCISISDDESRGWGIYFGYNYSNLYVFIMSACSGIALVVLEKKHGMLSIIRICKWGRRELICKKIRMIVVISFAFVILFDCENLILVNNMCGFCNIRIPVQTMSDYVYCPYRISIFDLLIIREIVRCVEVVVVCLVAVSLSVITYNNIFALLVTFGFIALASKTQNMLFNIRQEGAWVIEADKMLRGFYATDINGKVVSSIHIQIFVYFVLILVFVVLSCFLFCKVTANRNCFREKVENRHTQKIKESKIEYSKHSTSLITNEFVKLFANYRVFILVIFLLVCKCLPIFTYIMRDETNYDKLYKEYIITLSGEINDDKRKWLTSEYESIIDIIAIYDNKKTEYDLGIINKTEYSKYISIYYEAVERKIVVDVLLNHLNYIDKMEGNNRIAWFVFDSGWKSFLLSGFDYVSYFAIIIVVSSLFKCELETENNGFNDMLRTTKKGRKESFFAKIFVSAIVSFGVAIIYINVEYLIYRCFNLLPGSDSPVISIEEMCLVDIPATLYQYFLYNAMIRILSIISLSISVCCLMVIIKNRLTCFAITSIFPFIHIAIINNTFKHMKIGMLSGLEGYSNINSIKDIILFVFVNYLFLILIICFTTRQCEIH